MSAKLTPWFQIKQDGQPIHAGFYDVKYTKRDSATWLYFDGGKWLFDPNSWETEFGNSTKNSHHEYWRGQTKP